MNEIDYFFNREAGFNCQNITLDSPIVHVIERGKFVFITLLNKKKYRVSSDGYFVRADLRIVK
jgi:hypothetical protein